MSVTMTAGKASLWVAGWMGMPADGFEIARPSDNLIHENVVRRSRWIPKAAKPVDKQINSPGGNRGISAVC